MQSDSAPSELQSRLVAIIESLRDDHDVMFHMDANMYTDLGMDSLQAVALVVEIEREFGVRIPEEDIPNLPTGSLLLEYITQ